jgi:undecaprenyl-diphosphatase
VIGLDRGLERWQVHHRPEPLSHLAVWLSDLGAFGLVWIALAIVLGVLYRRFALGGIVLLTIVLSEPLSFSLRQAIGRDRPPVRFVEPEPLIATPNSHSFPSGHSTTAFACATVLAAYVPRFRPGFYALAALIAWSRVVVGVHYPLDVLAGAALGTVLGLLVLRALPLLGRAPRRSRRPRQPG